MQNLTARYNIMYNANILLDGSVENIENGYIDNFQQLLPVYKEPSEALSTAEIPILDSVIRKANTIVNDKVNSNYVDDGYMLVAKANYLKAQFFNAAEYFSYIYNTYPLEKDIRQESLVWKARALMQLENISEAAIALDTALKYVELSKDNKADVYATYAQLLITRGRDSEAIAMLEKAIEHVKTKKTKIRWTYILAQLQEENKQYAEAYSNFSRVVKSNASFEMAFNANLNRIKIEEQESGKEVDRITRLRSLLRDDKNKDFTDQIYYQIGNIYAENNRQDEAIEAYTTSIQKSTTNLNQKGLAYLSIADIYFRQADYVGAKSYYDSTLIALSPKYPGYDIILKKSNNLQLLASRYKIISREDTLQTLARLPEVQREERIAELVREQSQNAINQINQQQTPNNLLAGIDNPTAARTAEGKFYFNNARAMSQGLTDFKRTWGNRRLEDNWRRAVKTAEEITQTMDSDPDAPIGASLPVPQNSISPEAARQHYVRDLPLTEDLLHRSNQRIAEAYYDIANFYKDELKDDQLAIKTYEELLKHSPQSTYTLPVYYNLYRLYQPVDASKSLRYKELIFSNYPESAFAKVIKDPNYSRVSDENQVALNKSYNEVFDAYSERKYTEVLSLVKTLEQKFPQSNLSPQLSYLSAMATGHIQKLDAFETTLQFIANTYPDDQLVTPLVKLHLKYIEENRAQMSSRKTALVDFDPLEPAYVEEPVIASRVPATLKQPVNTAQVPILDTPEIDQTTTTTENAAKNNTPDEEIATNVSPQTSTSQASPFNLPGTGQYYFVINVLNPTLTLSSSRFGVGQFNRTKYAQTTLKHQLLDVNNENQLIIVGVFNTYEDVKAYESAISPLLPDIVKVPTEQYTTFVITKESLDKLQNRQLINSYIEFYKNSN